eukprot:SAG22_NODE_15410_length_349_cov_0.828000_1_plen_101_part_01
MTSAYSPEDFPEESPSDRAGYYGFPNAAFYPCDSGTVAEAVRLQQSTKTKRKPPVYAYTWAYYNSVVTKGNKFPSTLLSEPDIKTEIELPYAAGAQGLVIW